MPFHVRKRGKVWQIVRSDTGKVVGRSSSKLKAMISKRYREQGSKDLR